MNVEKLYESNGVEKQPSRPLVEDLEISKIEAPISSEAPTQVRRPSGLGKS